MIAIPVSIIPLGLRLIRKVPFPHKLGLLEMLFGGRLSGLGEVAILCANGYEWTLDLREVTHRWLVYGDYEGPHQMKWLRDCLSGGGIFIDSGANIGQYVVSLAHLPNVRTFAFEPVSREREWLRYSLNRYPKWDVTVVPFALGEQKRHVRIRLAGGKSTFREDWYANQNLDQEVVFMTTLDAFASEHGIDQISLWKLDMEGYEPQALLGAQRLLSEQRIKSLLIECQSSTIKAVKDALAIGKYSLFIINRAGKLVPAPERIEDVGFEGNLIALSPIPGCV